MNLKNLDYKSILFYAGVGFAGLFAYDTYRKHKLASGGFATGQLGTCTSKSYSVSLDKINSVIAALQAAGATVAGSNPWYVDTNQFGVKLQGSYDVSSSTLTVAVTAKNILAPCDKIWQTLDGYIASV